MNLFDIEYRDVANATSVKSIKNQDLPKIPDEKVIIGQPITEANIGSSDSSGYIPTDTLVGILVRTFLLIHFGLMS